MKLLSKLFGRRKQLKKKTIEEYQQDLLIQQGREQFKKLADKGLAIPVVLL